MTLIRLLYALAAVVLFIGLIRLVAIMVPHRSQDQQILIHKAK